MSVAKNADKIDIDSLVGKEVAIRSWRYPEGKIVTFEKDRWGVFWSESWHKYRPHEEENFELFLLSKQEFNHED